MIRINLFKKQNIDMNLLIGTLEKEKFNMPMYNTDITLWKGVDNTIEFSIRNHDRKAIHLDEGTILNFIAINQDMKQEIKKELEIVNESLGRYKTTLTSDELNDFDCGTFIGHVSASVNGSEELLYSGTDWYPYFNVELKPNKLSLIEEPIVLTEFNKDMYQDDITGKTYEMFTSSIIKSDVTSNHTYILKLKEFEGTIKIQGSNEENPEHNQNDWFDINVINFDTVTDETITVNCDGKFLNTRVQYIRENNKTSILSEIQYRN